MKLRCKDGVIRKFVLPKPSLYKRSGWDEACCDAWWWHDAIQRRLKAYDRCRALAEEAKK